MAAVDSSAKEQRRSIAAWLLVAAGLVGLGIVACLGNSAVREGRPASRAVFAAPGTSATTLHLPYLGRRHEAVPWLEFAGMVGGPSWTVAALGDLALVGDGPHIVALDTTDPDNVREIGRSRPLPGLPLAIALDRERGVGVVAASSAGIVTLDLRDPTRLRLLGLTATGAITDARGVALDGETAVVAAGLQGFATVDLADPRQPEVVGRWGEGSPKSAVAAHAGLAVLLTAFGAEPPPDSYIISPDARPAQMSEGYADYLPAVLDVSDATSPTLLARLPISASLGSTLDVRMLSSSRIRSDRPAADRRIPHGPHISAAVFGRGRPVPGGRRRNRELLMLDRRVFVASSGGAPCNDGARCLEGWDLADPGRPRRLPMPSGVWGEQMAIDEARGLLITRTAGPVGLLSGRLAVLDAQAEPGPSLRGDGEARMRVGVLAMHGRRAYGSSAPLPLSMFGADWGLTMLGWPFPGASDPQLEIFDLTVPSAPAPNGVHPLGLTAVTQLESLGEEVLALVRSDPGDLGSRLTVWRIDPKTPSRRVIEWAMQGSEQLYVHGETVFALRLGETQGSVSAFDMGAPGRAHRMAAGRFVLPGSSGSPHMVWAGEHLWLAVPSASTPEEPPSTTLLGLRWDGVESLRLDMETTVSDYVVDLAAIEGRLLLLSPARLRLIDPYLPDAQPIERDTLALPSNSRVRRVAAQGSRAFVAGPGRLDVLRVSEDQLLLDSTLSLEAPGLPPTRQTSSMSLQGGRLVTAGPGGVRAVDVAADPPRLVGAALLPPPLAADLAGWPHARPGFISHGAVALSGGTIVSSLKMDEREPVTHRSIGLTTWRWPGERR